MGCIYYGYYPDDFDESRDFPEKVYVGSAINFEVRERVHGWSFINGKQNPIFQRAYEKRDKKLPIFVIFEDNIPNEDLLSWEQAAFEFFAYPGREIPYYNMAPFAGNTYGVECSQETRQKISEAHIGKMLGENNPNYGKTGENSIWWNKKHTEETKNQMSEAAMGRIVSEETKDKMRKPKSEEAKENMRKSWLERKETEEYAEQIAQRVGWHHSEEAKAKLSKAKIQTHCKRGHEFTPENTTIKYKNGRPYKSCRICAKNNYINDRIKNGLKIYTEENIDCCRKGHKFTPENTRINGKGERVCKTCEKNRRKRKSK